MGNKQEPTQPEGVAPEQTPPPAWEVKDGRIFIDGDDVTEIVNPSYQDEPDEGTKPPQADNAAVEGEGQEPEEPEEKAEPEPEKVEPEKPTEEPPEEPEAPGEPDKW
ncbi:MAG TPA: hypothetical protein VLA34_10935, partial [Candidatus Krumholzibacterium sp.]|nr:hypothetical protein [Candidatus Krumholzibacterium sp.]